MPGAILQQGCMIQCPHGGVAQVVTSNRKVKLGGSPVLLPTDTFIVAGCPFTIGTKPQPCLTIEWMLEAVRVKADGVGVLLESSVGLCKSAEGVPQGTALVSAVQTRVKGT